LHDIDIPEWAVKRVLQRRGAEHVLTGLDAFLRPRGIDTLIITGCLTDVCCESTARVAMMLNYQAIMATDT
jgi:nicotinamidase-related amidase